MAKAPSTVEEVPTDEPVVETVVEGAPEAPQVVLAKPIKVVEVNGTTIEDF